ncbi:MAG TPA: sodium:solute symporter family protein [Bacteroidota bacterium]|nr:sodium:solute symporter family protein [Bacteroidota bacterium]
MIISTVDLCIIIGYFCTAILLGIFVSRRAKKNIHSYFLGSNTLPWWILGISDASGMFDITGTMWLVYILFVYGFKSVFLPWVWPTFNQIFLMAYLSIWLRKSKVMTGAQWIETRFGTSTGARLSHISVVIFALVSVIGFIAYAFKGIGKFAAVFFPWNLTCTLANGFVIQSPDMYAIILMSLTAIYAVKGGMFSVVITEFLQFIVLTIASLTIGVIAFSMVSPEQLQHVVPAGWTSPFFGWHLNLNWTGLIDAVNTKIQTDGYSMFGFFFIMVLFQGIFKAGAGPAPNYDMQRVLATRSPKDASKMNWFVNVVLIFPRYTLITGITVLALLHFSPQLQAMGPNIDFEMILPYIIKNILPVGLVGLLLAGLIAAFMSNYAATINAAPAYVVNDIYKRFINPHAEDKKYVQLSYLTTIAFVIIGFLFGFLVDSINQVTLWIVNWLYGGYTASNILKWYWWRFNGHGYFWGMIAGIITSLVIPIAFPAIPVMLAFPYVFAVSFAGCIVGSLLTKPEADEVLMKFYMQVHPWGFWRPVLQNVRRYYPSFEPNKNFKLDMFNIATGIIWQTSLVVLPMSLVTKQYGLLIGVTCCIILTSIILKISWWNNLERLSKETLPADFDERMKHGVPQQVPASKILTADSAIAERVR